MFAQLFALSALALLAAATPAPVPGGEPASSCSTAPVQCCETVTSAGSSAASGILAAIGVVVQDVNAVVGLTCSPISVIGVGGGSAWYVYVVIVKLFVSARTDWRLGQLCERRLLRRQLSR